MTVTDRQRAQILMERAANRSYGEIADRVEGVSKNQVGKVVREAEEQADQRGAEEVVIEAILSGAVEVAASDAAADLKNLF